MSDEAHKLHQLPARQKGMTVSELVEHLARLLSSGSVNDDTEVWFGSGVEGDEDYPCAAPYWNMTAIWPRLDPLTGIVEDEEWWRYDDCQHRLSGVLMFRP